MPENPVTCHHYVDSGCAVAGSLFDLPTLPVADGVCHYCTRSTRPGPMQLNAVTGGVALRWARQHAPEALERVRQTVSPFLECKQNGQKSKYAVRSVLFTQYQSPGDVTVLTAAVETIRSMTHGAIRMGVDTSCPAVWENNPHIVPMSKDDKDVTVLKCEYPLIHLSDKMPVPFLSAFMHYIGMKLKIPPIVATNRPHLYLSAEEKSWVGRIEELTGEKRPYWIVNAGIKPDFTAKQWPLEYYQDVVDQTKDLVQWVQIGEAGHLHQPLEGVIDQIGKTTPREMIRLAYWCSGGIGPVTWLQHLCAAWEKPYVCLLGGREPVHWTAYPLQHTFHTIGALDCCATKACWKSRIVPLNDGDEKDKNLCTHPVTDMRVPVGKCMASITPREVVSVVQRIATQ